MWLEFPIEVVHNHVRLRREKENERSGNTTQCPIDRASCSVFPPGNQKYREQKWIENRKQVQQILGDEIELKVAIPTNEMVPERNPIMCGLPP